MSEDYVRAELHTLTVSGRIEEARRVLPEVAGRITQLLVDNPGQFGLLVAGDVVAGRVLLNLVRPRTAAEALAVMAVLVAGLPALNMLAVRKGWIRLRIRDDDGALVPLEL